MNARGRRSRRGQTAWAMRKGTPALKRIVNEFIREQLQGTRIAAVGLANY
jgi:hypothetical protein